ncbi:helix-turn-helix transcriptional regulator [Kitasatospora sp. NPDC096077]|uniref:helix-turn-helix domain-containing protein n=1 Tax=Kitasatospora sp. NPDC096077 TaxID=3155544 RepID=UPI00332C5269
MDGRRPLIEDFPTHPDGDPAAELARVVRERRTESGLSLAQLAERSGLGEGQLRAVEAGHAAPTLPLLAALSEAMRDAQVHPHE